jgi:hypothetical protein
MRQSGRASIVTVLAIVSVLLVVLLLAFSRESLTSVGGRFMDALQRGDVDTLTRMTYLGNKSEEQVRKEWDFTVNTAGRHYEFLYQILSARQSGSDSGVVRMHVIRNPRQGGFEEVFNLPLVKVGDDWKVDVRGINRDMYPGLPR